VSDVQIDPLLNGATTVREWWYLGFKHLQAAYTGTHIAILCMARQATMRDPSHAENAQDKSLRRRDRREASRSENVSACLTNRFTVVRRCIA